VTSNGLGKLPVELVDVIVLGAGPAGISCALELKECKVECLVLERNQRPGGQLLEIPTPISNLAVGSFDSGETLSKSFSQLIENVDINLVLRENVVSCDLRDKSLVTETQQFQARALFLATGYRMKLLPDSDRFQAFGQDIVYHTGNCQNEFASRDIVILGGGDSAVLEALERARSANSVTLVNRSANYKARPDLMQEVAANKKIRRLDNFVVKELLGEGQLQAVELRSTTDDTIMKVEAAKLIVKIGYSPNTEIFRGQVDMDSTGHIRIDPDCRTSIDGVYAGGDIVTPGYDRIATAIGHGMLAAKSIRRYLER